jgi:hypothetical protein
VAHAEGGEVKAAYPDILPPLSGEVFQKLKADILAHGQQVAIEVDVNTGEIIDGYHRYKACLELKLTPILHERHFASEEDRLWVFISLNLLRRHMSKSKKAYLIIEYKLEAERKKAKERQVQNGKRADYGRTAHKNPAMMQGSYLTKSEAVEEAAKNAGISPRTVYSALQLKKESPEEYEKLRTEEQSAITGLRKIGKEKSATVYKKLQESVTRGCKRCTRMAEDLEEMKANLKEARVEIRKLNGQAARAREQEEEGRRIWKAFVTELRKKRKEARDGELNSNWRHEAISKAEMHDMLDWAERYGEQQSQLRS